MSDSSPLTQAVVDALLQRIDSGEYLAGRGLPSERKLADEFSVSRIIIRAALRDLEAEGWIACKPNCRPIVREQNSRPRPSTSSVRHLAIWLWPNSAEFCASTILKGIQSAEVPEDVRLVVANAQMPSDWDACLEAEDRFLRSLTSDPHVMGAILWYLGGARNLPSLQKLRDAGIPMVFVDRQPPEGFESDFVGTDNQQAFERGMTHLVELGHTRIALISNQDSVSSVREREAGYRLALAQGGVPFDSSLIYRDLSDDPEGVEFGLSQLLDLPCPPTAIACINDHVALQVYESLEARGFSIPEDFSVLGFDGLLRWVPGNGYLTTCMQDFERIGRLATELVLERSRTRAPKAHRHLLLDAPLSICGSTESPRSRPTCTCKPGTE